MTVKKATDRIRSRHALRLMRLRSKARTQRNPHLKTGELRSDSRHHLQIAAGWLRQGQGMPKRAAFESLVEFSCDDLTQLTDEAYMIDIKWTLLQCWIHFHRSDEMIVVGKALGQRT